jgi:hypothetical protein
LVLAAIGLVLEEQGSWLDGEVSRLSIDGLIVNGCLVWTAVVSIRKEKGEQKLADVIRDIKTDMQNVFRKREGTSDSFGLFGMPNKTIEDKKETTEEKERQTWSLDGFKKRTKERRESLVASPMVIKSKSYFLIF